MKRKGILWKTEYLLLLCTAVFLGGLLCLQIHDKASFEQTGIETERYVETDAVRAKPELLDLNAAGQDELEKLPGIGEELAKRILDYRAAEGDFSAVEELMNVSGIGEKKFAGLEEYITVNGGDEP